MHVAVAAAELDSDVSDGMLHQSLTTASTPAADHHADDHDDDGDYDRSDYLNTTRPAPPLVAQVCTTFRPLT